MTPLNVHAGKDSTKIKAILKIFWILLFITIIEILWGMFISHRFPTSINALFFFSFTLVKAFYIMADFMHLKYEIKPFIITALLPFILFIWFIIAFCYDGISWLNLQKQFNSLHTFKVEKDKLPHKTH